MSEDHQQSTEEARDDEYDWLFTPWDEEECATASTSVELPSSTQPSSLGVHAPHAAQQELQPGWRPWEGTALLPIVNRVESKTSTHNSEEDVLALGKEHTISGKLNNITTK